MKCKYCGKDFKPKNCRQQYCCPECRKAWYNKNYATLYKTGKPKPKQTYQKVCIECGRTFLTHNKRTAYCSDKCINAKYLVKKNQDREFTSLTPYLCQKWRREGMPIRQIADTLNRSIQNVKQALAVPLTKEAYEDMRQFAK